MSKRSNKNFANRLSECQINMKMCSFAKMKEISLHVK